MFAPLTDSYESYRISLLKQQLGQLQGELRYMEEGLCPDQNFLRDLRARITLKRVELGHFGISVP
jgi:hypothetical protein